VTEEDDAVENETENENAKEARDYKAQRLENELKKLDTSHDPTPRPTMDKQNLVEDETESATEIHFVHQNELSSDFGEPKTFKEALWCGTNKEKWKPSMGSEVMNFLNRKAWRKTPKEKMWKLHKKILKVKWAFKMKDEQDGSV
jgi:hypothetical protein